MVFTNLSKKILHGLLEILDSQQDFIIDRWFFHIAFNIFLFQNDSYISGYVLQNYQIADSKFEFFLKASIYLSLEKNIDTAIYLMDFIQILSYFYIVLYSLLLRNTKKNRLLDNINKLIAIFYKFFWLILFIPLLKENMKMLFFTTPPIPYMLIAGTTLILLLCFPFLMYLQMPFFLEQEQPLFSPMITVILIIHTFLYYKVNSLTVKLLTQLVLSLFYLIHFFRSIWIFQTIQYFFLQSIIFIIIGVDQTIITFENAFYIFTILAPLVLVTQIYFTSIKLENINPKISQKMLYQMEILYTYSRYDDLENKFFFYCYFRNHQKNCRNVQCLCQKQTDNYASWLDQEYVSQMISFWFKDLLHQEKNRSHQTYEDLCYRYIYFLKENIANPTRALYEFSVITQSHQNKTFYFRLIIDYMLYRIKESIQTYYKRHQVKRMQKKSKKMKNQSREQIFKFQHYQMKCMDELLKLLKAKVKYYQESKNTYQNINLQLNKNLQVGIQLYNFKINFMDYFNQASNYLKEKQPMLHLQILMNIIYHNDLSTAQVKSQELQLYLLERKAIPQFECYHLLLQQMITVTASITKNYGSIYSAEMLPTLINLLKANQDTRIDHIDQIMPSFLSSQHQTMVKNYIERGYTENLIEPFNSYLQSSLGYIIPVTLQISHYYFHHQSEFLIKGGILKISSQSQTFLFDSNGFILGMTEKLFFFLYQQWYYDNYVDQDTISSISTKKKLNKTKSASLYFDDYITEPKFQLFLSQYLNLLNHSKLNIFLIFPSLMTLIEKNVETIKTSKLQHIILQQQEQQKLVVPQQYFQLCLDYSQTNHTSQNCILQKELQTFNIKASKRFLDLNKNFYHNQKVLQFRIRFDLQFELIGKPSNLAKISVDNALIKYYRVHITSIKPLKLKRNSRNLSVNLNFFTSVGLKRCSVSVRNFKQHKLYYDISKNKSSRDQSTTNNDVSDEPLLTHQSMMRKPFQLNPIQESLQENEPESEQLFNDRKVKLMKTDPNEVQPKQNDSYVESIDYSGDDKDDSAVSQSNNDSQNDEDDITESESESEIMLGEESLEGSDKFKKSDEQKNERNKNKEKAQLELNNDQTSLGSMNSTSETSLAKSQIENIFKKTKSRLKMIKGILLAEILFTVLQIIIGQTIQISFDNIFNRYLNNHQVIEYASILFEQHCHFQNGLIAEYLDQYSYYKSSTNQLQTIYISKQFELSHNLTLIILDQFKDFQYLVMKHQYQNQDYFQFENNMNSKVKAHYLNAKRFNLQKELNKSIHFFPLQYQRAKNISIEYGDHADVNSEIYLFVYMGMASLLFIVLVWKLQKLLRLQENLIMISQRFNEQDCNELIFIQNALKDKIIDYSNYNWLNFDHYFDKIQDQGMMLQIGQQQTNKKVDGFYSQRLLNKQLKCFDQNVQINLIFILLIVGFFVGGYVLSKSVYNDVMDYNYYLKWTLDYRIETQKAISSFQTLQLLKWNQTQSDMIDYLEQKTLEYSGFEYLDHLETAFQENESIKKLNIQRYLRDNLCINITSCTLFLHGLAGYQSQLTKILKHQNFDMDQEMEFTLMSSIIVQKALMIIFYQIKKGCDQEIINGKQDNFLFWTTLSAILTIVFLIAIGVKNYKISKNLKYIIFSVKMLPPHRLTDKGTQGLIKKVYDIID